jgi:polysaccharide biosynthesis transport protein
MPEEKKSGDNNKLDRPIHSEARPESRMDETSLVRSNVVTPISSMDQVAYNYYNAAATGDTPSIREYWRKIRKRKWLVLAVTVIVTTIVAVESFRMKSTYQATATVALIDDKPSIFKFGDAFFGSSNGDMLKTDLLLLRTYPLLAKVVVRYRLNEDSNFLQADAPRSMMETAGVIFTGLTGSASRESAGDQPNFDPPPQIDGPLSQGEIERLAPYIAKLDESLYISQVEETRAIQIRFTHTDPAIATKIANGTAQVFVDERLANKTARSNSSATWLDRTTRQLKAQMEEAERNLAEYGRNNDIFYSSDEKQNLVVIKLSDLYDKSLKAETNANSKESLYEEVKQGRVARLPEAFSDPGITQNQTKLSGLEIDLAQLIAVFGPENPRVIATRNQMKELQRQVEESTKNLGERLKAEAERARSEEKLLNESFESAKAEAIQQNQSAIKFNILKQNVDTTKALYNDFLQKTNQAQIEQQQDANDMRIIDPARAALVGPRRGRAIFIGLILSLAAGVGLALLLEYLDNTVKNVEDVSRATQLPTLALIPSMSAEAIRLDAGKKSGLQKIIRSGGAKLAKSANSGNSGDYGGIVESPSGAPAGLVASSSVVESYRMLRTSLLLSNAGAPPKTILVTSSQPGEGKTTTAVNTAISLSQLGASVLLIDADLRRPAVHKAFKIPHSHGISNYLSSHTPIDDLIVKLPIPNLYALPCGPIPPNPAELISSDRMKELLIALGQRFDHILIDSPPMVSVTDPIILSTMVDGLILVVQAGRSTQELARRARRELARAGARVFGVVLNNVNVRREGYDDYDYYRYTSAYNEGYRGANAD